MRAAPLLALLLVLACAGPRSAAPALQEGAQALAGGQVGAAVRALDEAVALDSLNLDARRLRVDAYLRDGRLPELTARLKSQAVERPADAAARYEVGLALFVAGAREEALGHLTAAAAGLPGRPEPWLRLGAAQLELDRPAEARSSLEQGVQLAPDEPRARLLLALCLSHLAADAPGAEGARLRQESLAQMERFLHLGPAPADVERARQVAHVLLDPLRGLPADLAPVVKEVTERVKAGDTGRALDLLEPLAGRDAPLVLELLGLCHVHRGESAEAAEALQRAVELDATRPQPRRYLADLFHDGGQHDRAAALYAEVVDRDPFDEGARSRLSAYLLARGDAAAAVPHLEALLALAGGDPGVRLRLARARLRAGDAGGARRDLEAIAAAPDPTPDALLELGQLYLELARAGRSRELARRAAEAFERTIAGRPGDAAALEGLAAARAY